MNSLVSTISSLLETRRTTSPKRLMAPGPTPEHLALILQAASHAPDHGQLTPWRFVVIPQVARFALGAAFRQALLDRDASASVSELSQAEEKAQRAPLLLAAILKQAQKDRPEVPDSERLISLGCAIQNMLLMATALGYGSALTSGKALRHPAMGQLLKLAPHEALTCFLNIGTPGRRPKDQLRPHHEQYTSTLTLP